LRYLFEGYALDPDRRELRCGARLIAVEPQVFDLLEYLIRNRERVVSRDELIASIWGGRAISESALGTRINAVRSSVGDSGAAQRLVKTLPRKGVRFVAAVREEQAPARAVDADTAEPGLDRAAPETAKISIAERRQVTVASCELLIEQARSSGDLDVEDLRQAFGAFHGCVAEIAARFEGFVANCVGNTVLVVFGYPTAHEHDPDQAVRSALAVCSQVPDLKPRRDLGLQARVGISTSMAVVGDIVRAGQARQLEIIGNAPNIATRLATLAQPGTVALDQATRRLVGNLFECGSLGDVAAAVGDQSIGVWRALKESAVGSRFEALHSETLSPLIGREEEIALLVRRWSQAKSGGGRVVLISGEPGIGKSRLIRELQDRLTGETQNRVDYFASAHHQDSALYPFAAELERCAGITHEDAPEARLHKLKTLLEESGDDTADAATLFADLISLPSESADASLVANPQRKRELTLQAFMRRFAGFSRQRPALVVVEDAHWLDSTSLELLETIVERLPQSPTLLLVSSRPEFQSAWIGHSHVSAIVLSRLEERDAAALVGKVAGGASLPQDIVERIVKRTDGIPLFVEELTKSVLEEDALRKGDGRCGLDGPLVALPATLHASLMARLDRLPRAKEVAQIGALLGREFSYEALAAVADQPAEQLQQALDQLVSAGLAFRRGVPPGGSFIFKHALVQDAAYGTLLRGQRRQLHARVAAVLEERFPETAATQPEILAHHFTEGGLIDSAISYWIAAGEHAMGRSAAIEAIQHLTRGIELIALLPPGPDRNRKELGLTLALGQATWTVNGYGPETLRVHHRARDLLDENATLDERMTVLVSLWRIETHRGELESALDLNQQCIALAQSDERAEVLGHAYRLMGMTLCFMGRFIEAKQHLERAVELYRGGAEGITTLTLFGADHAQAMLSLVLWPLGYPERALAAASEAVERATRTKHAVAVGVARVMTGLVRIGLGCSNLQCDADETAAYCTEHSVKMFVPWAHFNQGVAAAQGDDPRRGIESMQSALAAAKAIDAHVLRPWQLYNLAAAYARIGQARLALATLDEAIERATTKDERQFEAELYRLRGELLFASGATEEAEAALRRAIDVARRREARMWELRAATSLARLLQGNGRREEGRALLAPVYSWFTEGFSTPDLKDARDLLDRLK
jgi:DNA-binding winged helix-turn-helix (wHTH) protein/tetratricopeptide (TPR) repeat protein